MKRGIRQILALFGILMLIILVDVSGYMLIEHVDFSDALFMTVITITTVGYREVFALSSGGQMFTIWVIISGLGTFFYIAGSLAERLVEGNIKRLLGRSKMKNINKLKDHVVIAGYGIMGENVCRELCKSTTQFVIIERDIERFAAAEEKDYHVMMGDATDDDILRQAGVEKAKIFISLLSSDADNVFTVMTAREVNPSIYIITRAMDSGNKNKLHKIGANRVVTPYELSARRIVNTVIRPNVVDFIDVMTYSPKIAISIEELTIYENSPFAGKKIKDSRLRDDYNIIVIAIKRKQDTIFNPASEETINPGDILILVGQKENLLRVN